MGHQLFEVPVIQQDLRHEETIVQIADSLEYLDCMFNDVFRRIEERIEVNKSKLAALHARANVTKAQVQKLTGSNKATKVFSSAKYPATEVHKDCISSFVAHEPLQMKHRPEKIVSSHLPSEGKILQEKLQFYHVKVTNKLLRRNIEIAPEEGLGNLPRDIDSISSLLLFNTSENPYKRYVMLDPLGAITKTRQTEDEDEGPQMEAAPHSISHHEKMERQQHETYFYSPAAPPSADIQKGDARTNLMEAIRQAGGSGKAKLAKKRLVEAKKKEDEKFVGEGSGDLMADLHAKLAMRRKGISGVIKNTESSAMDRIKDMIPAPVVRDRTSSNTEEDEDWE